jgi:ATP-dependent RNA helicase DeaD
MNQSARNRSLSLFRSGELHALVATDVAGRGLDIQDVTQVIHLDLPYDADTLTHRSGRTGRAGRKGVSRMIATPSTVRKAMRLAQFAKIKLQEVKIPSRDELIAMRSERMFSQLVAPAETSFDPALLELASRLSTHENAQQIIASLLSKSGVMGVTPRELSEPSLSRRGADPRAPKRPRRDERDFGESRGPRSRRDESDGGESRGPRPPRGDRIAGDTSYAVFRVEAGRFDGIEVRHLIPMLCRRGNIFGTDLGNIRLENHYSLVEVAERVAEKFERHVAGAHEASDVDIGRFDGAIPERRASRGPHEGFESRGPRGAGGGGFGRSGGKPRSDFGGPRYPRNDGDRPSNFPPRGPRPGGFGAPSERPPRPHFDERRPWSPKPGEDPPKWRDRETPAFGKRAPRTFGEQSGDAPAKRRVVSEANPPKRPKKKPANDT